MYRPGAHAVFIDAFDIEARDFIADDFVDVSPDSSLTQRANQDGVLDTSAITANETITARDSTPSINPRVKHLNGYRFNQWLVVDELTRFSAPSPGLQVNGHDIIAHPKDIMVAIAMYNEIARPVRAHLDTPTIMRG